MTSPLDHESSLLRHPGSVAGILGELATRPLKPFLLLFVHRQPLRDPFHVQNQLLTLILTSSRTSLPIRGVFARAKLARERVYEYSFRQAIRPDQSSRIPLTTVE